VDPSEEAKKLSVLNPMVRAEVNAALKNGERAQGAHIVEAETAVGKMQRILDKFPPPTEGSLAMETHGTHLALARAELSRVTGPDPVLWQDAMERADYIYFRLYATLRYGEAMGQVGDREAGIKEIGSARAEASRIGAQGLVRLVDATLSLTSQ
jgi:hypothetical protein